MPIGSATAAAAIKATWSIACRRGDSRVVKCPYAYPASSAAWKKRTVQVHTCGVAPSSGSTSFPTIGSRTNSSAAFSARAAE